MTTRRNILPTEATELIASYLTMDILNRSPLSLDTLAWQPRAGFTSYAVICRATFTLAPDTCPLAEREEPPNTSDDRVPYKSRPELILVGSAFAATEAETHSIVAHLAVERIKKSIAIFGERTWTPACAVRKGKGFHKMPLTYDLAAGGPGTENPAGVPASGRARPQELPFLPNLQPLGVVVRSPNDVIPPIGFAPIPPTWPVRAGKLGALGASRSPDAWSREPLPADFDHSFFNLAPMDQQLDENQEFHPYSAILLQHLHPAHPILRTRLPGVRPRVTLEPTSGPPADLKMRCDTLWIDTDRGVCSLTWRGRIDVARAEDLPRALIAIEHTPAPSAEAMPPMPELLSITQTLPSARPVTEVVAPLPGVRLPPPPPPSPPSSVPAAPPALVTPGGAVLGPPSGAPSHPAPSLGGKPAGAPPPPPMAPPPPDALPPHSPKITPPGSFGAPLRPTFLIDEPIPDAPPIAIPLPSQPTVPTQPESRTAIELIWFNVGSLSRIRKHPAWENILTRVKARAEDEHLDDETRPSRPRSPKDRRDLMAILTRGNPLDTQNALHELECAKKDADGFIPPLVLVEGSLEVKFDEAQALNAALACAGAYVGRDKLEDIVARGREVLKAPWGSSKVCVELGCDVRRRLTKDCRDQFEHDVEQTLLDGRTLDGKCWRKRVIFGQMRIVATLSSESGPVLPTYFPEELQNELPAARFKARVLAEVRAGLDPVSDKAALRVVALGRIV